MGKTEADWQQAVTAFVKAKMKEADVTYVEMAKRLKNHGFNETEASLTMKLKRGAFAATFLMACLAALELDSFRLAEL